MARFGRDHAAQTLIVAGVRFMGETSKILSPHKRVLMPTLEAECSLDLGCPIDQFSAFCDAHPDHIVVVYANTSAAVKARADWVVTSSIALEIVEHLDSQGHKIIWGPDRHLGAYIEKKTGAEMLRWQGHCIVHDEFNGGAARAEGPEPGCRRAGAPGVPSLRDRTGRCGGFYQPADQGGQGAAPAEADRGDRSRHLLQDAAGLPGERDGGGADRWRWRDLPQLRPLPWMAMNGLVAIKEALTDGAERHEILVDEDLRVKALVPLDRMLDFAAELKLKTQGNA
jgi:quinolinate synthase